MGVVLSQFEQGAAFVGDYAAAAALLHERLAALPGIGRSTAAAIAAFCFGERAAILDGNVKRVLARYHGIRGWTGASAVEKKLWELSEAHLPHERLTDYTQAIMDFGATLCTRSDPACVLCPLQDDCVARREGRIAELPTPKPGKVAPQKHACVLWLLNAEGAVLMQRRPASGIWASRSLYSSRHRRSRCGHGSRTSTLPWPASSFWR